MTRARDLSKLLSTANGKIAGANLDVSFENISDTGTQGTKVASGTTAQRGSTAGQIRFNSETGLAEYYDGTIFKSIDSPPTVTAISPLEVDSSAGGNITFTITGSNFQSGAVAKFIGNDATEITASTTTVTNSTTISAVIARSSFVGAKEPYDVRVINTTGLSGTLDNQINVDVSPTWSTASGSLGSFGEGTSVNTTVSATDADGDTVSYSETGGTVLTTNGITLNSSTGGITGTAPTVNADTTLSFTLRATANSKTADRGFSISILNADGTSQSRATENLSAISYDNTNGTPHKKWVLVNGIAKNVYVKNHGDGWYWVCTHTFGGTNTVTTNNNDVLIRAGTFFTTENMQNATTDYLRFSDNSNNYVTSAQNSSFWAMEGTANPYGSDYGSNAQFFQWWAHSSNLARLHIYGDLTSKIPTTCTHGLWKAYDNYGSGGLLIADANGSTVYSSSASGFTPSTARFSLGTLSNTGSHGFMRDGDGNTNQVYELWVGHQ